MRESARTEPPAASLVSSAVPPREEQRRQLRKSHYVNGKRAGLPVRPLLAVEDVLRSGLLRTGIDSRAVTFSWFVVALAAYAVTTIGTPWAFASGAVLVYLKIALDIADGELGRYQKRFMTEAEDVASYMKGIYLDRVQHAIESPLWGVALGIGGYRLTGEMWCIVAGIVIALARSFWRFERLVTTNLAATFAQRIEAVGRAQQAMEKPAGSERRRRRWGGRIGSSLTLWVRNGKRFNFLILSAGVFDWIVLAATGRVVFVPILLGASATCCLLNLLWRIGRTQLTDDLVQQVVRTTNP